MMNNLTNANARVGSSKYFFNFPLSGFTVPALFGFSLNLTFSGNAEPHNYSGNNSWVLLTSPASAVYSERSGGTAHSSTLLVQK